MTKQLNGKPDNDLENLVFAFKNTVFIIAGLGTIFFGSLSISETPLSWWVAGVIMLGGITSMAIGVIDLVLRLLNKPILGDKLHA